MKKVCLVSLGCAKNLVDSELMLGRYQKEGFQISADPRTSDVIVVATCGFIEEAKRESIDKILEMARYKRRGGVTPPLLVVTGCLSQRYGAELARELPEVDLFLGVDQILPDPDLPRIQSTPSHYSYVKISEGCSHTCSFCTIPQIRGRLRSRPMESIVRELRQGIDRGVKEFNLIAQDLNEYGRDLEDGTNLSRLLVALDKIHGDFWIRCLYMYPLEFSDRLIGVLRDSDHIVKYVDIPLQHISERILRSMRRGSGARHARNLLKNLKKEIPQVILRTTFIVGYPGETEKEFKELCDFVSEVAFDRVGVFKYSQEEGTMAAGLPDQVPNEIKDERYDRLMRLSQRLSLKKNKELVGKRFRFLSEGVETGHPKRIRGRLPSQAPEIDGVTFLRGTSVKVGHFIPVTITEAQEYDLTAILATI